MISRRVTLLLATLAAAFSFGTASAQQPKTSEQQARSYILSAFMTGSAPSILSEDVKVSPTLRERLGVTAQADGRAVYLALVRLTAGKSLTVRPAKIGELEMTGTQVQIDRPVFALDVSDSTFLLAYDLARDSVTVVADASRPVAVTSPVSEPEAPQAIVIQAAAADIAQPWAAKAAETAPSPPAAEPPPSAPVQLTEARIEEPLPSPAPPASAPPTQVTREEPRRQPLKPNGACVIKPVMSDQDLANCGASPR